MLLGQLLQHLKIAWHGGDVEGGGFVAAGGAGRHLVGLIASLAPTLPGAVEAFQCGALLDAGGADGVGLVEAGVEGVAGAAPGAGPARAGGLGCAFDEGDAHAGIGAGAGVLPVEVVVQRLVDVEFTAGEVGVGATDLQQLVGAAQHGHRLVFGVADVPIAAVESVV